MTFYFTTPMTRSTRRYVNHTGNNEHVETNVRFPIDVKAEEDAFVMTAFLPGLQPEDLNIQVTNETVTLQGDLKIGKDDNTPYLLNELPSGRFFRTLTFPEPLNANEAQANLENGVLSLRVPKAEEARPKTIKVVSKN